jgi:hypothetical protein
LGEWNCGWGFYLGGMISDDKRKEEILDKEEERREKLSVDACRFDQRTLYCLNYLHLERSLSYDPLISQKSLHRT